MSQEVRLERAETDEYIGPLSVRIPSEWLEELSRVNSLKSVGQIALEWAFIVLAVWFTQTFWNPLLYVCAVVWVGTRMHALAILFHDAAHYRILKDKKLNDIVGDLLLGWPLLVNVAGYRKNHFAHHRSVNTPDDPDWVIKLGETDYEFPRRRREILLVWSRYFLGINAVKFFKTIFKRVGGHVKVPRAMKIARPLYYLAILAAFVYSGRWPVLLMYWVVPYLTSFLFCLYVRSVAEHFGGMEYDHVLTQSRTVYPAWWERLLIAQNNINYHLDHHLYPSVPFYNLPKLHKVLLDDPVYRKKAHLTRGYTHGLLAECSKGCEQQAQPSALG
jgi:fatty acid desaturase